MTDYTDFDGAQARVTNGVLYIKWTPPAAGRQRNVIMPLSTICEITWEKGDSKLLIGGDGQSGWAINCQKPEELAGFIGRYMEGYYAEKWEQFFPGHGTKADA